jgi:hypothetical protein
VNDGRDSGTRPGRGDGADSGATRRSEGGTSVGRHAGAAIREGVSWLARLRFGSLRLRLVAVFAAVALTAAVSASGIAYWLNRDAVLTRAQNAALDDFRASMTRNVGSLPADPPCDELQEAAVRMAQNTQDYSVLLLSDGDGGVR